LKVEAAMNTLKKVAAKVMEWFLDEGATRPDYINENIDNRFK